MENTCSSKIKSILFNDDFCGYIVYMSDLRSFQFQAKRYDDHFEAESSSHDLEFNEEFSSRFNSDAEKKAIIDFMEKYSKDYITELNEDYSFYIDGAVDSVYVPIYVYSKQSHNTHKSRKMITNFNRSKF